MAASVSRLSRTLGTTPSTRTLPRPGNECFSRGPCCGSVTNEAYPQTREFDGGFCVMELPTRETQVEWAAKIANSCRCSQELREFQFEPESYAALGPKVCRRSTNGLSGRSPRRSSHSRGAHPLHRADV